MTAAVGAGVTAAALADGAGVGAIDGIELGRALVAGPAASGSTGVALAGAGVTTASSVGSSARAPAHATTTMAALSRNEVMRTGRIMLLTQVCRVWRDASPGGTPRIGPLP